jgi:hypothetical protein
VLAPVVRVAPVAQVVRVVQAVQVVPAVPVARLVQASVDLVPASAVAQARQAVRLSVAQVALADDRAADQALVAVAASVVEPPVPSERVVLADPRRLASRSVPNAKSSNKEPHRALVARSFHAETEAPSSAFVADPAFRTSPTRLMPTPVS